MNEIPFFPKSILDLINQVFEIERKCNNLTESNTIMRNIVRIKDIFETDFWISSGGQHMTILWHNPIGEKVDITRTDFEISIAGEGVEDLVITEVVKPIIYLKIDGAQKVIQRGVGVASTRST